MGNFATVRLGDRWIFALLLGSLPVLGQTAVRPDWRHVGNSAVELGLAGLASGPVERVWFEGGHLRIRTSLGTAYESRDFAPWETVDGKPPSVPRESVQTLPEPDAQVRVAPSDPFRVYAFGRFVYRSEDGGRHWENTTGYRGESIIGDGLRDLAIAPGNAAELVVAGGAGVYRSADGGASWHGLNDELPNLPGARLRRVPPGGGGPQIELADGLVLDWMPGERRAWNLASNDTARYEAALRAYLTQEFDVEISAVAVRGNVVYAGDVNGRLSVSSDGMRSWLHSADPRRGRVNAFWVDPEDGRVALAALAVRPGVSPLGLLEPLTVLHTINGGGGWDLVSTNLPAAGVNGLSADPASSTVYVASDQGVYMARLSLRTFGAAPRWSAVAGLPGGRVTDVLLDAAQTQLWAAVEGLGVYAALAPHRLSDPRVVSAADLIARAIAPGALLSVAGARVESASAGGLDVPVLISGDAESQIQIPFSAAGNRLTLAVRGAEGARVFAPLELAAAAPAIFEADGTPLVLDADHGVMLDGGHPAQSRMRVQILAAGLGRVRPEWPAGVPAPLDNSPQVVAPVAVYLDREPVEVLRAVLAPGYTGVYLVEVELPVLWQSGLAELYLEVAGQASNRVWVPITGGV